MTITGRGVQIIQEALDHIHNNPDEWNQNDWMHMRDIEGDLIPQSQFNPCGTACCFAGRVALQQPEFGLGLGKVWYDPFTGVDTDHPVPVVWMDQVTYNGKLVYTDEAVVSLLLRWSNDRDEDADTLNEMFSGHNEEATLWGYGQELTNNALEVPADVTL